MDFGSEKREHLLTPQQRNRNSSKITAGLPRLSLFISVVVVLVAVLDLSVPQIAAQSPAELVKKDASFRRRRQSDDVVFTADVLWEGLVRSRLQCFKQCSLTGGCVLATVYATSSSSSNESPLKISCRLYVSVHDPTDSKRSVAGAQSFGLMTTTANDDTSTTAQVTTAQVTTTAVTTVTPVTTQVTTQVTTAPPVTTVPPATIIPQLACPDTYVQGCGRCLLLEKSTRSYADARSFCEKTTGGWLALVKTNMDLLCVGLFMNANGGYYAWVGADDIGATEAGQVRWTDGEPLLDSSELWDAGHPAQDDIGQRGVTLNYGDSGKGLRTTLSSRTQYQLCQCRGL